MDLMFRHGMTPTQRLIWLKRLAGGGGGSSVIKTVSGALIHITDALAKPLKKLVVNLEPVQTGSGEPSPINVRPIIAVDGCNVYDRGANLWDEVWHAGTINQNNGTNYDSSPNTIRSDTFCPCKPSTVYCSSIVDLTIYVRIFWYDINKAYIGYNSMTYSMGGKATSPNNAYYFKISPVNYGSTTYNNDICISLENNGYVAYNSASTTETYTLPDAAGTVYGCAITINEDGSGKLVVDRAKITLNTSTLSYNNYGFFQFYNLLPGSKSGWQDEGVFCNKLPHLDNVSSVTRTNGFAIQGTTARVALTNVVASGENIDAAKEELGETVDFVYLIADPVEYTLTESQALTLLKGENVVWCDNSDSLELQYYAKAEETP